MHYRLPGPEGDVKNRGRTWSTLMYWKTMLDRCLCINSRKTLLKFGIKYGTKFCHRLAAKVRVHD